MASQPRTCADCGPDITLCRGCVAHGSRSLLAAIDGARLRDEIALDPLLALRISVRGLAHHAARLSGLVVEDLLGPDRHAPVVRVRHAMVLVAIEYPMSLPQIGRAMGGRDHSTVINSRERGRALAERDPDFARFVERLWAAAECEPMGPGGAHSRELSPAIDGPAVSRERGAKAVASRVPPLRVRSEPGEYAPRHALPPVLAVVDCFDEPEDEDAASDGLAVRGSAALLTALRREFPERCAA